MLPTWETYHDNWVIPMVITHQPDAEFPYRFHPSPEARPKGPGPESRCARRQVARSSTVPVSQRPAPSTPRQPMSSRPTSSPKQEERFTVVEAYAFPFFCGRGGGAALCGVGLKGTKRKPIHLLCVCFFEGAISRHRVVLSNSTVRCVL